MDTITYRRLNKWQFDLQYRPPEGKLARRFIFKRIIDAVDNRLIATLEGPRRLGKTTLLLQVVDYLLVKKVNPQKIHLYEFSELDTNIKGVFEYAVNKSQSGDALYLLLDEAQYCADWQAIVKHYYDHFPNLYILITGSTSLYLNRSKESLLGRRLPLKLDFLTFREYLYLAYQQKVDKYNFASGKEGEADSIANGVWQTRELFYEYLQYGEIPALLSLKSSEVKNDYLKNSVLDLFFTKDVNLFSVEKPREIQVLYRTLAQNSAQVLNKSQLASKLQLSRPTVGKYLDILVDSGMIGLVNNYYRSLRKQETANKKVFLKSVNLLLQALEIKSFREIIYEDFQGHLFENAVYNQLLAYFDRLYFWNRGRQEVDFLTHKKGEFIPIEVKKTDNAERIKLKSLLAVIKRLGVETGWVIYTGKNQVRQVEEREIRFVNAFEL